jgi:hypothetical protein
MPEVLPQVPAQMVQGLRHEPEVRASLPVPEPVERILDLREALQPSGAGRFY